MKNKLFALGIILSLASFTPINAQEVKSISVSGEVVEYTDVYEDVENAISYYNNEVLVLTAYDTNTDGEPDMWAYLEKGEGVTKEMRDSDGDGEVDIIHTFNVQGELIGSTGEGLHKYEIDIESATGDSGGEGRNVVEDYAGDLEDIQKLEGEGGGISLWLIVLALVAGGYYWMKKRK